jgi:hypothetical protein
MSKLEMSMEDSQKELDCSQENLQRFCKEIGMLDKYSYLYSSKAVKDKPSLKLRCRLLYQHIFIW